jgi:hypothetical protein
MLEFLQHQRQQQCREQQGQRRQQQGQCWQQLQRCQQLSILGNSRTVPVGDFPDLKNGREVWPSLNDSCCWPPWDKSCCPGKQ